ncbi:outer membrane receptor for ferrienterochelin and colicin [Burkholderiales bacterium JOSHI_001]|nr:outer membrane receptor for ferrienterochelin and colicin [Burkholderiales bacterium JOSHI_001]
MNRHHLPLLALALAAASLNTAAADLAGLSLEELMKVEVTSVAKKAQALGNVAAAVHVITEEDIRASGARSLPEALRLAPGVDVAQISGSRWAVSIRGGTGRFANKLQVMIDGRSVYSSLFSGVFWEAERMPLSEVERIEVLRGPAGSTWGANSVNGVINIITKAAVATGGTRVAAAGGSPGLVDLDADTSFAIGANAALRIYGRAHRIGSGDTGGALAALGDAADAARAQTAGLRLDHHGDDGVHSTLRVGLVHGESGDRWLQASVAPPYGSYPAAVQTHDRVVAQGQQVRGLGEASELTLSAAALAEDAKISGSLRHRYSMAEFDIQHRWWGWDGHDISWGAGLRYNHSVGSAGDMATFVPPRKDWTEWRLFAQDEWLLVPERLRATLGLRVDRHPYAGAQAQPSVRLLWNASTNTSLWAAVSRAVRAPSRGESDIQLNLAVLPPGTAANPGPLPVQLRVNAPFDAPISERLDALELGLRSQLDKTLSLDLALFEHRYRPDFTRVAGAPQFVPGPLPYLLVDLNSRAVSSRTHGVEAALDWRPTARWRQQFSYALLDAAANGTPRHQLKLRSVVDVQDRLRVQALLRYASERLSADLQTQGQAVAAGTALDLAVAWRVNASTELTLGGTDLLRPARVEFVPDLALSAPAVIGPRWSLQLQTRF